MKKGFWWVLGDGESISATKDPWLRKKTDFRVEYSHRYEGRNESVASLFTVNTKNWNTRLIRENFESVDVEAILATTIPQRE